jgi:hypothetical protein
MVDIAQYLSQLKERRKTLEQAKTSAEQAQLEFSQQQLRGTQPLQRQQAMQQFQESRQEAIQAIEPQLQEQERLEQEFGEYERQKAEYDAAVKKQQDYERGYDIAMSDKPYGVFALENETMREGYRAGRAGFKEQEKYLQAIQTQKESIKKWEEETGGKIGFGTTPEGYPLTFSTKIKDITIGGKTYTPAEYETQIQTQQVEFDKYQANLLASKQDILTPKPSIDMTWKDWGAKVASAFRIPLVGVPSIDFKKLYSAPSPQEMVAAKYGPQILEKTRAIKLPLFVLPGTTLEVKSPIGMMEEISKGIDVMKKEQALKALEGIEVPGPYTRIIKGVGKDVVGPFDYATKKISGGIVKAIPYETRKKYLVDVPLKIYQPFRPSPTKQITLISEYGERKVMEVPREFKPIPGAPEDITKKKITIEDIKPIPILGTIVKGYETEVKTGIREPGFTKFFLEKLGEGYKEPFMGLTESYVQLQEGKLVSPWIGVKDKTYQFSLRAKAAGFVGGAIGRTQLYFVPFVGKTLFAAPFVEATARGDLGPYVKKHPFETALTVAVFAVPIIKYAKKPIVTQKGWFVKPKETIKYGMSVKKIDSVWKAKLKLTQEYGRGAYYRLYQPRYQTWMQQIGLREVPKVTTKIPKSLIGTTAKIPKIIKIKEGIITFTKVQPKIRVTRTPWFGIKKGKYIAETYVGKAKIPRLYFVQKGPKGPIFQYVNKADIEGIKIDFGKGKVSLDTQFIEGIRPRVGTTVKATKFDVTLLKKGKDVRVDLFIGKKPTTETVLYSKLKGAKEARFKETEFVKWIKDTTQIKKLTPTGRIKDLGEMKGLIKIYKPSFKTIQVYDVGGLKPIKASGFESQLIKKVSKISKLTKPTKVYSWMRDAGAKEAQTISTKGGQLLQQIGMTPTKEITKVVKEIKQIPIVVQKITLTAPKVKIETATKTLDLAFAGAASITKLITREKLKEEEKLILKGKEQLIEIPKIVEIVKSTAVQTPKIIQAETPALKLITKPIIKPIAKPILKITPTPKPKPRPRIERTRFTPVYIPLSEEEPIKSIIKVSPPRRPEKVIAFGRRYGKFKPISVPTTIEKAKKKGIVWVSKTLGATFEIRGLKGKRLPIGRLPKGFRFGKKEKDIFQAVQRRERRLKSPSEVAEIIRIRRGGLIFK